VLLEKKKAILCKPKPMYALDNTKEIYTRQRDSFFKHKGKGG